MYPTRPIAGRARRGLCFVLAAMLCPVALAATTADSAQPNKLPEPGTAAIASAHPLATLAGFEVLAAGGNAFDAAIAVESTLALVQPQSSGLGGGFFAILRPAASGKAIMLDAREAAPAAVNRDDYKKADGTPDRDASLNGPLAAGIPGAPAGIVWIAEHYGKLPLSKSLAPAIRIAREGFQPNKSTLEAITRRAEIIRRYPASAKLLLPGGKLPQAGWVLRNPDFAGTLEAIAKNGHEGFYAGETAHELVEGVQAAGGNWTLADLAGYQAKPRQPIEFDYNDYHIVTVSPPSSGGVALAEILNILSGYQLDDMDKIQRVHYIIEAMRRAFRDHNEYLGDPDFVDMPLDMLLSPFYAAGMRASILPHKATPSSMLPKALARNTGRHTSHYSIIDAQGNIAAVTTTVNTLFGSTFVAPGTGFVLNNEMDDFALVANAPNAYGLLGSEANKPEAGKRMLSSMSPTIVLGENRIGVIGSPGGSTIITQVLEGILAFIDGASAKEIVSKPRFHHQYLPDTVYLEPETFTADQRKKLEEMGYTLKNRGHWGFMNVVTWDLASNSLDAASDPRREGLAKVAAIEPEPQTKAAATE